MKRPWGIWRMVGGVAIILLAACGKESVPLPLVPTSTPRMASPTPIYIRITAAPPPSPAAPTAPTEKTEVPTPTLSASRTLLERAVSQAQQDLARRLNLPEGEITLVDTVSDEFPAANLGCPSESGTPPAPMPALVSGWRIILKAGGTAYEYRARGSDLVFCGAR